jgi:hypothetical protein
MRCCSDGVESLKRGFAVEEKQMRLTTKNTKITKVRKQMALFLNFVCFAAKVLEAGWVDA